MNKNIIYLTLASFLFFGCSPKIPMASKQQDTIKKQFKVPKNKSGVYVYRNSIFGSALIKTVFLDDKVLGPIATKTYLYKEITPGKHKLSTTSEFSPNNIYFNALAGKNYYFRHYIKMGLLVGGANIEPISSKIAKKEILQCNLAK